MSIVGYKLIIPALFASVACAIPGMSYAQITPDIVEAAKKEAEVMFYGAITINSSKAIGDLFEKKYGIKLRHWRGDATELINRSLAGETGVRCDLGQRSRDDDPQRQKYLCEVRSAGGEGISEAIS